MPIDIAEVTSTVQVDDSRGPDTATSPTGTAPGVLDLQRWLELTRRSEQLALRTAAWGFDD